MANDEIDGAAIDRLVQQLAAPPKPAPKPPAPKPVAAVAAVETAPPPAPQRDLAPGRPWTTARLLMPAMRKEQKKPFGFASAISLPALPKIQVPALNEMQWGPLAVRVFVGLSVVFGWAMRYWPYSHAWSWGLLLYLAAVELLIVAGIWGAKLTWDTRLPGAHTLAVGTMVWGLGLLAAETVPRILCA